MKKLLAFFVVACFADLPCAAQTGLTEGPRLSALYDTILEARTDETTAALAKACPPAPTEACQALRAAALWWQIKLNPNDRSLDDDLERASTSAIDAADRWTKREPGRAEAWFYLAGSYGPLVQWKIKRGHRVSAARSAVTIKNALERAIALDPTLRDAYFGIGLYHYIADVASVGAKILRTLLLLPGGDRQQGLREMLEARDAGVLLRGEADYQMHFLYLWYENQPAHALTLLQGLDARYPSNPLFLERIAEVQRDQLQDHTASLASWQTLLARAAAGRVARAPMIDVRARIGMAQELVALSQPARAIEVLAPLDVSHPAAPYGAESLAHLVGGLAHERLGNNDRARAAFRSAMSSAPSDDPENIRARARRAIEQLR